MKFSYSEVWDDTSRMLRANAPLLVALAGVFLFLPALLIAYFLPQPQSTPDRMLTDFLAYMRTNLHWMLLSRLVGMVGTIAMLILLLGRGGATVGAAIAGSFSLLIGYFLASFLSTLMIVVGAFFFLIPGLYLLGRLAPLGPAIVAERLRNPLAALRRAFELTRGKGWAILGLVAIVFLAGFLLSFVVTAVLGAIFLLAAGKGLGGVLVLIVQSAASAAVSTVVVVLFAAIYRRLAGEASAGLAADQR